MLVYAARLQRVEPAQQVLSWVLSATPSQQYVARRGGREDLGQSLRWIA